VRVKYGHDYAQDFRDELSQPACSKQVHILAQRAGQDIRFDEPLADACFEDRARLCDGVQPGSARVIRCLQDAREDLSYECRSTLFDAEVGLWCPFCACITTAGPG
jgi:Golgi apparatus protein 1